jgi:GntR family transcriptional regulator
MFDFEFDSQSDLPLWVQLRQRLVYLINSGRYQAGDQLPTVRGLASDLSINYNTVNKAYLSLTNDGYITSTRGRGVFVNDIGEGENDESLLAADELLDDSIDALRELGLTTDEVRALLYRKLRTLGEDEGNGTQVTGDAKVAKLIPISKASKRSA